MLLGVRLRRAGHTRAVRPASYSGACTGASNSDLIKDYGYDYLDRLTSFASYSGGSLTDDASYTYDALNRVVTQQEGHNLAGTPKRRTTTFSYLGLSSLVTQEDFTGARKYDKKTYSYDAYGNRISMTNDAVDNTQDKSYTYAYDVHGSVSMLLDESSNATVSYGYDAYGDKDGGLSGNDSDDQDPLNAFRYTAKRFDSGSGTLDMGARRFGPDTTRFLQQDQYMGALSDLGLSLDPLTQNRYSLAGGNPVSFVETDGHRVVADGGGGGSTDPNPSKGANVDGWAAGAASGGDGSSAGSTTASSQPTPAPSPGPYPDCSISECSDDGIDFAGDVKGLCDFVGPCAVADAVGEGNWLGAALEVAMMLPLGKAFKLGKLVGRADDVVDATRGIDDAVRLGRAGEASAGIVKNTARIESITGTASYRIPDVLNRTEGIIGEVKNVSSLSYSSQLRDFSLYAQQQGYRFDLYVRPSTYLSGPLQQAIDAGDIALRYLP